MRDKVDRWQTIETYIGKHPDDSAPEGYSPMGPWEPMGVGHFWDGAGNAYSTVVWKRPLKEDA